MNAEQALEFVARHGVVLVSAKDQVPTLTEAIAGAPIKGSWWGHPQGKQIFAILEAVSAHDDVLVCRLLHNKITLVHRRLWPAIAALAAELPADNIARVTQQHTASGKHANIETPFPLWLPDAAATQAMQMTPLQARAELGL